MTQTQFRPTRTAPALSAPRPSEFYRAEAARLRDMADSSEYHGVREGLRCIAREYELLADQRDGLLHHRFGEPLRRPVMSVSVVLRAPWLRMPALPVPTGVPTGSPAAPMDATLVRSVTPPHLPSQRRVETRSVRCPAHRRVNSNPC